MSTINLQMPDSLLERIAEITKQDGVTIDQFINCAVSEKLSAFATVEYLHQRANRADQNKFQEALSYIPDVEPEEHDRL